MKNILSLLAILLVATTGCDKDKATTEPRFNIESISPGTVVSGNIIRLEGRFTDREGDIDSALVVYKWYNGATAFLPLDTLRYSFEFLGLPPNTTSGELTVSFEYNTFNTGNLSIPGVSIRDTSATFGLILIDKAGHRSELEESAQIRLIKP